MNKKSGLLAVSGLTNDIRDLLEAAEGGNERAKLALDMFVYSTCRNVGRHVVRPWAGQTPWCSPPAPVRTPPTSAAWSPERLGCMGFVLDDEKNVQRHDEPLVDRGPRLARGASS